MGLQWPICLTYREAIPHIVTRDSIDGNRVALSVTVIVTEARNVWKAAPTFSRRKMSGKCENLK